MSEQQTRGLRIVRCPQCRAPVAWTAESKWRPFCSERCKTLDLGAWASERYRVSTDDAPGDTDSDRLPDGTSDDGR